MKRWPDKSLLWGLSIFGLFIMGVSSTVYFFSVPQKCDCQVTTIPDALSSASIFENSIWDSNKITIRTPDSGGFGELQICYSQKPTRALQMNGLG